MRIRTHHPVRADRSEHIKKHPDNPNDQLSAQANQPQEAQKSHGVISFAATVLLVAWAIITRSILRKISALQLTHSPSNRFPPHLRMKSNTPLTIALLLSFLSAISPARAEEPTAESRTLRAVDGYAKAWDESDAEKRAAFLDQAWAKEGQYRDPNVTIVGAKALALHMGEFHQAFPKARIFPTSKVDFYGPVFRAAWSLDFGNSNPLFHGYDFGELDTDGRIIRLTSFFGLLPDTKTTANEALVAGYMDGLFKKFDMAALDKLIAQDARYTQAVGLPYGGTFIGLPEWVKMYTHAGTYFNLQVIDEPTYYTNPTTGKVVANFTIKVFSKKSDRQLTMAILEQFELKDGKIVAITPFYFDTKTFVKFLSE